MANVLVVEDEAGIALRLEDTLRLEGYDVEVVTDGGRAIRRALESPFDLILLDVMLPGCSGFEVCRELRRAGFEAPIIFLSARTQEVDRVSGLDLGANDYVTKPFSPKELVARVRGLLRTVERGRKGSAPARRRPPAVRRRRVVPVGSGFSRTASPVPAFTSAEATADKLATMPPRHRDTESLCLFLCTLARDFCVHGSGTNCVSG